MDWVGAQADEAVVDGSEAFWLNEVEHMQKWCNSAFDQFWVASYRLSIAEEALQRVRGGADSAGASGEADSR